MPRRKVNKAEKRVELAYKAYEYISEYGIEKFNTNSFIKYLDIGKSSFYNYFTSRDEIIYEIVYLLSYDYLKDVEGLIKQDISFKEKIEIYFGLYLTENEETTKFIELYKEFLYININLNKQKLSDRDNTLLEDYLKILEKIIQNEIDKGTIHKEAINHVNTLFSCADGMLLYSFTIPGFNLAKELKKSLDSFISLVEVKR